ncbi:hypothetical protein ACIRD8_17110 [Streptomyces sp. NPDC102451]|uniref:hypothetical protein n=1 Tax=Streptomyces sp. NPDC102451 TaxID=3366177 RepID=UPI0038257594
MITCDCSVIAGAGGIELTEAIPAPLLWYFLGFLTACASEFILPRIVRFWRYAAIFILAFQGISPVYLSGILLGLSLFVAFGAQGRTRRQTIGVLLQTLVPVLLVAMAYRSLTLPDNDDPAGPWAVALAIPLATAGIFWAIPYGKKQYWHDLWAFRSPHIPFLDLSRDGNRNVPFMAALPGQHALLGLGLWLVGWPCTLGALGMSFWGIHHVLTTPIKSSTDGLFVLLAPMGVAIFDRSRKLFLLGRRHMGMVVSEKKFFRPGTYVLYLRSFEDDKQRAVLKDQIWPRGVGHNPDPAGGTIFLVTSSRDEEEHIADAMRPVGQLIAIGAPEEVLPFAGAVRMYLPKESWKQPVRELMEHSRLVTLSLGSSAGTVWELSEAMRILPPQRLLLMMPGATSKEEYGKIREEVGTALRALPDSDMNKTWRGKVPPTLPDYPHEKPENSPVSGLIHFSADWQPVFTPTPPLRRPWGNLFMQLIRGLRPAFDQLASYEDRTGRRFG